MHHPKEDKIIRALKTGKITKQEISNQFHLTVEECENILNDFADRGIEVISERRGKNEELFIQTTPKKEKGIKEYSLPLNPDGWYQFGIVSDTHLNSKYSAMKQLNSIYDDFEKEKVSLVIHAGDLTDGNGKIYPGQIYEMQEIGYENILQKIIREYPKRENVKTAVISGNHDLSFWKENGSDIIKQTAEKRDDMDYLGQISSNLKIQEVETYAVHPDGNMPYSRSYRMQKMIEQIYHKPDILIRGHLHVAMYIPYLGVQGIESGCFQFQTPYLERKGLYPEIGGWLIKFKLDKRKRLKDFQPVWKAK